MNRPLALTAVALSLALVAPSAAIAKEKNGVTLADSINVDGKTLTLQGLGLRTKMMFKVYVAGLYLEKPSSDAATVISSDQTKRVQMVMMRNLGRGKIVDAVESGFEKNTPKDKMAALKERLDNFTAAIPDIKEGESLTITYAPGKGITVTAPGKSLTVPGKDFADALFSVWLGEHPVDDSLKNGMLGK